MIVGRQRDYGARLRRIYAFYTLGFIVFVVVLGLLEKLGMSRATIGYVFLGATIVLYATIGVVSRTNDPDEYYVAGRRVPAMFNGMATGADWMSAASFISLAGGLYARGYSGLAFIMGWTGGYVLVALFLAPYLRRFGRFTIPDFLGARYGGHIARLVGVSVVLVCSFAYLVAQIYGVGLITTRLTGVEFQVGIFLGLAGIIVCSFLGGMRAVTWTQVAQYIVLIIAYTIPVVWLSVKLTGVPLPQFAYGTQLKAVTQIEERLLGDPAELEARALFRERAEAARLRMVNPERAYVDGRRELEVRMVKARSSGDRAEIRRAERDILEYPVDIRAAKRRWQTEMAQGARASPPVRHGEAFPGKDERERDAGRRNFLALMFCLMIGTAALPHILMRSYTTPTVRAARGSVTWSLIFICLLYFTAPALAVLVKYVVYTDVVGTSFGSLPAWVEQWQRVDPSLLSLIDINLDGIVQRAELMIGEDIVVLAAPEIAGLPYVISGLVAAGGLAAALSTADGLLLTITNALAHDTYYRVIDPGAPSARRVLLSKILLLVVAVLAAVTAAQRAGEILFMVGAAFSLAASGFFPALVLGIFWKRATGLGAVAGMIAGFLTSFYYMSITHPALREFIHGIARSEPITSRWWDIEPISAGVFGVPVGFATIIAVSLLTPRPAASTLAMVEEIRYPNLPGR
ncbi:MAG: cation acetate symporter [Burkholderiaceae bacterium]|nr:cation acetate symporter [Burkholderiaceae bacterium]